MYIGTRYTWHRLPLVGKSDVAVRKQTTGHYEASTFSSDNHIFVGKNWQLNIPYIRVNLLTVETSGDYKYWIYMGEFFDGERPFYVELEVRYKDGTLKSASGSISGNTKVSLHSSTDDTFGIANNFSDYFYIDNRAGDENYDGPKRFYFTYANHRTGRRFDLLAVTDQFDNAIKYQYMSNGVKMFDTFGREITLTNTNGNGIITDTISL